MAADTEAFEERDVDGDLLAVLVGYADDPLALLVATDVVDERGEHVEVALRVQVSTRVAELEARLDLAPLRRVERLEERALYKALCSVSATGSAADPRPQGKQAAVEVQRVIDVDVTRCPPAHEQLRGSDSTET